MRSDRVCVGVIGLIAVAGSAYGGISATCTIDGVSRELPFMYENGCFTLLPGTFQFESAVLEILDVLGGRSPDASFAYGIAVTDFGAPSLFSFTFSTPIALDPGPLGAEASIVGGVTDFTGNGVGITPFPNAKTQRTSLKSGANPPVPLAIDVGDALSVGAGSAGANHAYGPFGASTAVVPAGSWDTLVVESSFQLSGDDDVAALTGFARVYVVPAPTGAALAALGAAIGLRRRRA